ncbi:biliverdin-producing heme oxygenase [Luteimonas aestuarii]|uniref:biliverdin-producing heme oxygenase n=1 Tax=Luteimonas aestuarii TaxID=453837 RepID=UPI00140549E8|nr:biliverdin-producing heme oxygenase [Luteimonas aestuarii]
MPIHLQPLAGTAAPVAADAARSRLRQATADLHAQVDAMFPRGLGSALAYRRYVLGMHRFAVDYEIATMALPRASAWLAQDLVALSQLPLPAHGTRSPLVDHAERLGWDYVMAGSSMGARVLLRDVGRLGFDASFGAVFLARHASGADWPRVQSRLAELDAGDARRMAAAEAGARAAFALVRNCLERSFEALHFSSDMEASS